MIDFALLPDGDGGPALVVWSNIERRLRALCDLLAESSPPKGLNSPIKDVGRLGVHRARPLLGETGCVAVAAAMSRAKICLHHAIVVAHEMQREPVA